MAARRSRCPDGRAGCPTHGTGRPVCGLYRSITARYREDALEPLRQELLRRDPAPGPERETAFCRG